MKPSERCSWGGKQRGFAFFWVLILVALMGVGLTNFSLVDATISQREKEKELLSIGRQFRTAISRYYESQLAGRGREYPQSLEDLLQDKRVPGIRRHLRKVFVDPMTGKAEWGLLLVNGRIAGVHSLSERVPIKQAGFEPEDMGFAGKIKLSDWIFTYPSDLLLRPDMSIPPVPAVSASGSRP